MLLHEVSDLSHTYTVCSLTQCETPGMTETLRFGIFTLIPALQGVFVVNKLAQPVRMFSGKRSHACYVTGLSSVCYQL